MKKILVATLIMIMMVSSAYAMEGRGGIGWNLEHYYDLKEVDLFIIDDFWTHYLSQQLYPKKKAWYIHGVLS